MKKPLRESFAKALVVWAEAHPAPDAPAMSLGSGYLSPREIAAAVKSNSPEGQLLCRIVEHAATSSGESCEQIFARFKAPRP